MLLKVDGLLPSGCVLLAGRFGLVFPTSCVGFQHLKLACLLFAFGLSQMQRVTLSGELLLEVGTGLESCIAVLADGSLLSPQLGQLSFQLLQLLVLLVILQEVALQFLLDLMELQQGALVLCLDLQK